MTGQSDRLPVAVREYLAGEIARAEGREVCFVATIGPDGSVAEARAVARGTAETVLALPGVARRGDMVLHNHPSGRLEPSFADLDVAARLHDGGIGFGIISNDALALYVVVEVPKGRVEVKLDTPNVVALLTEGGAVAGLMGQYEDRQSQRDMAAYIADGYNDGGVLLLEAGTGVGKSFAYLVPALEWARANDERTIVSTNTINLQEQLVGKDLPLLRQALGTEERRPTFALLKGWRNYLCLARLEVATAGQQSLLEEGRIGELMAVAEWAGRTADGTLGDLATPPSSEVWDEVAAEPDLCPRLKCPSFDRCFLFKARRRAAEADIVVVNHHLLAADLAVRHASENWEEAAVLPPYKRLILDEAHHLEDVAATHLGSQLSAVGVRRTLGRLERSGRGLVPTLVRELTRDGDSLSRASLELIRRDLVPAIADARGASEAMFARLHGRLAAQGGGPIRLLEDFAGDDIWAEGLGVEVDAVAGAFRRIADGVATVADRMAQAEAGERRLQLVQELKAVVRRLEAAIDAVNATLRPVGGGAPVVRWIERTGQKGQNVSMAAVPLDLAPLLRELIFERNATVVLTSATLAAGGEFDFLESRLGLAEPPGRVAVREMLASPFDYPNQSLFGIPNDIPDPREDEAAHDDAVATVIRDLAYASDGGMFALFTSHGALRRCASRIRLELADRWPLLVQGEGTRNNLLKRFREAGNAILLGTDSFWEGVDVPGRALRTLVLCKLPFKVPSEPLTAARLERLADSGADGFFQYLLPHAALKLKQGFGRLIRSKSDVGVVVLLDSRVLSKRYGRWILAGLPKAARVEGPWSQVRLAAEDFFARHGIGAVT
ncbi:MAG: helicase [Gemmatimonadetes bacterium]|nr:helicase [Gemmatimonadota bacterium]